MLPRLIDWALQNRLTVLSLFLVLIYFGTKSAINLPMDAVPDITNVQVMVNAKTGALDPEKIEMLVTRPIEIEFAGLPHLQELRSISRFGLSQTTLVFEDGTDIYWARQLVAERLQTAARILPLGVAAELAPLTTGLGEVYMYVLQAKKDSELAKLSTKDRLTHIRTIQDFTVRPFLKRISGVADVDSNGGFAKEVHINIVPELLDRAGLSITQVEEALRNLGDNSGGGYIQRNGDQVIVRTLPVVPDLKSLENFPVLVTPIGKVITVKDVAIVRVDYTQRIGAATYDGDETVLGTVLMRVGANGRDVVRHVEEEIPKLKLPDEIELVPLYTRKFLVDNTIKTVGISLAEGAMLVIAILLFLLGHPVATLIVTLAIPISMVFAAFGMTLFGVTGNLMSLGAIDFGLLVDGAVVLMETIITRFNLLTYKPSKVEKRKLILESATEVIRPVVTGLVLIMVVYIPILMLEGVEGKMFRPMAITVILALLGSLFVAVFLIPVMADMFLKVKGDGKDHETFFFRLAHKTYVPLLNFALLRPVALISVAVAALLATFVVLSQMGSDFIPQLDEGDLVVGVTRDARIGVDKAVSEQIGVEKLLREMPEVKAVFTRLGTPDSATDPMGINLADTFVILEKDRSKWRFKTKDEIFEEISKNIRAQWPDSEVSATQPIEMRFNEMLEGSRADVSLRIFGPDLKVLFEAGEKAQEIISKVQGVESIDQDPLTALRMGPVLDIIPDFAMLSRYGIMLEHFNTTVATAMGGSEVGSFYQDGLRFPIVVHVAEEERANFERIAALPMDLPRGGTIPLEKVSRLEENQRVTTIARQWSERYSALSVNIKDRDLGGFVAEAQQKISEGLTLPPGYRLTWGGQFKNLERAQAKLMVIVPLTLLGVFLMLLKGFGDFGKTLLVFSSVPFAAVGGVFALYIRGLPMSVSAGVGFIALIGIALLNALVLVTVLGTEVTKGGDLVEAVKRATLSRLRPVLMTALVAGLGFIPMALNTGIGAEVQRPLATVVIGGLITATLLTLGLLPSLFLWKEK